MSYIFIILIRVYQRTLSPDHGLFKALYPYGFCRFYPTCSEYSIIVINKYGVIKGSYKAFLRILRCNPFSNPRVDNPHKD